MHGTGTAMKHLGLPRRHHDSHLPHEKLTLTSDKAEPHNALGLLNPSSKYFETSEPKLQTVLGDKPPWGGA